MIAPHGRDGQMRILAAAAVVATSAAAQPQFAPGQPVEDASGPIDVEHFASPCIADWDGDGIDDLILSEGFSVSSTCQGRFRLYPGRGEPGAPAFEDWSFMEADGEQIVLGSP
jgi:hypothetical protein